MKLADTFNSIQLIYGIILFFSNLVNIQLAFVKTDSISPEPIPSHVIKELTTRNEYFTDHTINYFIELVNRVTSFDMVNILNYYFPEKYAQETAHDDIQIIYGGEIGGNVVGHFICIYFNATSQSIQVYDSLYLRKLSPEQENILKHRYPGKEVIFMRPKSLQMDFTSCGAYVIAYATSLILGYDPVDFEFEVNTYDIDKSMALRRHIGAMFEMGQLIPFPIKQRDEF